VAIFNKPTTRQPTRRDIFEWVILMGSSINQASNQSIELNSTHFNPTHFHSKKVAKKNKTSTKKYTSQ